MVPARGGTGAAQAGATHKRVAPPVAGKRVQLVPGALAAQVAEVVVTRAVMSRHCMATVLQEAPGTRLLAELAPVARAQVVRARVARERVARARVARARVARARAESDRMAWRHSATTVRVAQVAQVARRAVAAAQVRAARADAVSQVLVGRMEPMVRALQRANAAPVPVAARWLAWAEPEEAVTPWAASRAVALQVPVMPAQAGAGRGAG
jgi:hypothetical protein